MNNQMRIDVILSGQEALVGSITPNIRAVLADWTDDCINISFVFDGSATPMNQDELRKVGQKLSKQFPKFKVNTKYQSIDFPKPLPSIQADQHTILYARRE